MKDIIEGRRSILEVSKRDIISSEGLFKLYKETNDEYYVESSCYLLHQGVEKYLKHLLEVRNGEYPREHSIKYLLNKLEDRGHILKGVIRDNLEDIVKWNVTMRYPANYYADIKILEECQKQMNELINIECEKFKKINSTNKKQVGKTSLFDNI